MKSTVSWLVAFVSRTQERRKSMGEIPKTRHLLLWVRIEDVVDRLGLLIGYQLDRLSNLIEIRTCLLSSGPTRAHHRHHHRFASYITCYRAYLMRKKEAKQQKTYRLSLYAIQRLIALITPTKFNKTALNPSLIPPLSNPGVPLRAYPKVPLKPPPKV